MNDMDLQKFIDNYTSTDFDRINLKWNGKYGQDFIDENYDFRLQFTLITLILFILLTREVIRILHCSSIRSISCDVRVIFSWVFSYFLV